MAMGDVVGEGLLVEDAGAENNPSLPGCESASNDWDGGVGLTQIDTLLLRLKLVLKNDGWLVATALGAGHLKEGDGKSFTCNQCTKSYFHKSDLLRHMNSDHDSFSCQV